MHLPAMLLPAATAQHALTLHPSAETNLFRSAALPPRRAAPERAGKAGRDLLPASGPVLMASEALDPIESFVDQAVGGDGLAVSPSDLFDAYKGFVERPPHGEESLTLNGVRAHTGIGVKALHFAYSFAFKVFDQLLRRSFVLPSQGRDKVPDAIAEHFDGHQRCRVGRRHFDAGLRHDCSNLDVLSPKSREDVAGRPVVASSGRHPTYICDADTGNPAAFIYRGAAAVRRDIVEAGRIVAWIVQAIAQGAAKDVSALVALALFIPGMVLGLAALVPMVLQ